MGESKLATFTQLRATVGTREQIAADPEPKDEQVLEHPARHAGSSPKAAGHDSIRLHWLEHYADRVASARGGIVTALNVTQRWAIAEVEYARARGVDPQPNVPPH